MKLFLFFFLVEMLICFLSWTVGEKINKALNRDKTEAVFTRLWEFLKTLLCGLDTHLRIYSSLKPELLETFLNIFGKYSALLFALFCRIPVFCGFFSCLFCLMASVLCDGCLCDFIV